MNLYFSILGKLVFHFFVICEVWVNLRLICEPPVFAGINFPVLDLMAEAFINELKDINLVVHSLVPERFKFTEDNKVGAYPHPVDVTNAGNGVLFMLVFYSYKQTK